MDHSALHTARLERLLSGPAYGLAWRYACRLAGTREDAEDLLQDALAHALLNVGQLRQDAAFPSWLLRIVRTCFLMARRSAARLTVAEAAPPELPTPPAWGLDADAEQALELAHALRALPPEQCALLGLHYIEGLGADDLALVHGVSRGVSSSNRAPPGAALLFLLALGMGVILACAGGRHSEW